MVSTGWAFSLIRFCWTADVRTPEELLKLMKVKRERHSVRDSTATYSVPVVAFYAQKKNTRTRHWSEILRNVRKTSTDRHIQTSFCALDMATLYTQWNTIDWRRHSRVETCGRSLPLKRITQYESYLGAFFHQLHRCFFFPDAFIPYGSVKKSDVLVPFTPEFAIALFSMGIWNFTKISTCLSDASEPSMLNMVCAAENIKAYPTYGAREHGRRHTSAMQFKVTVNWLRVPNSWVFLSFIV